MIICRRGRFGVVFFLITHTHTICTDSCVCVWTCTLSLIHSNSKKHTHTHGSSAFARALTYSLADRLHRQFFFFFSSLESLESESNPYVRPLRICVCVVFFFLFTSCSLAYGSCYEISTNSNVLYTVYDMNACMSSSLHTHTRMVEPDFGSGIWSVCMCVCIFSLH